MIDTTVAKAKRLVLARPNYESWEISTPANWPTNEDCSLFDYLVSKAKAPNAKNGVVKITAKEIRDLFFPKTKLSRVEQYKKIRKTLDTLIVVSIHVSRKTPESKKPGFASFALLGSYIGDSTKNGSRFSVGVNQIFLEYMERDDSEDIKKILRDLSSYERISSMLN